MVKRRTCKNHVGSFLLFPRRIKSFPNEVDKIYLMYDGRTRVLSLAPGI